MIFHLGRAGTTPEPADAALVFVSLGCLLTDARGVARAQQASARADDAAKRSAR